MPGCCSPRRAPASLHVGSEQVGLSRAAGLQLQRGCPGAPCQSQPPPKTSPSQTMLCSRTRAGRALLPVEGEEEVATLEQSFPSAPYIYCKVLWL